jgi:hypothetical protein
VTVLKPSQRSTNRRPPVPSPDGQRCWRRPWVRDALGITWVLAAAAAVMAPVLAHGTSLGPFDILAGSAHQPGVVIHNGQTFDQIAEIIPWTTQAWHQVHQGHLPLWNPESVLGMPLAFNWQSAPFSVPALLGYLAPVHLAYTVGVLVTLAIGGTGVYVLSRILHMGVLAAAMAGTVFELSGPFFSALGWPISSVMSWGGWFFALAILIVGAKHRIRDVALFAVVVACAIYAGQPDTLVVLILLFAVFIGVLLLMRALSSGGSRSVARPLVDLGFAGVAGAALGAPLLLPGLQLANQAIRLTDLNSATIRPADIVHIVFSSFDGTGVFPNAYFGDVGFVPTATYVGVIVVVLAVTALVLRRHQPEVVAFGAVLVASLGIVFVPPVSRLLFLLPHGHRVQWVRASLPMAMALAVLAGMGTDLLVRSYRDRAVRRWCGGGFAAFVVILLMLWGFGRGRLQPQETSIRAASFIWPVVETAVGLTVVGALAAWHIRARRRGLEHAHSRHGIGRWAAGALLLCETAFLVAADTPLWSSSSSFFASTPGELAIKHAVGSSLVGAGDRSLWVSLGITPSANVAYNIQELAVYDPMVPSAYFSSWKSASGASAHVPFSSRSTFSPLVTTVRLARLYGVSFVLEPRGVPGPTGAVFITSVGPAGRGGADLYRIPGVAAATLTPLTGNETRVSSDTPGKAVAVTHPSPASWKLVTHSNSRSVLRLRLTDVPGWHATIDGRALALHPFAGVMLEARLPAGTHTVELRYWPTAFTAGIILALCSVVGLIASLAVAWHRRDSRRSRVPIGHADGGTRTTEERTEPVPKGS